MPWVHSQAACIAVKATGLKLLLSNRVSTSAHPKMNQRRSSPEVKGAALIYKKLPSPVLLTTAVHTPGVPHFCAEVRCPFLDSAPGGHLAGGWELQLLPSEPPLADCTLGLRVPAVALIEDPVSGLGNGQGGWGGGHV